MSELIKKARLTDEELWVDFDYEHNYTECALCERHIADAATAKTLWAMVEWLAEHSGQVTDRNGESDDAADVLAELLTQAGIEKPSVT